VNTLTGAVISCICIFCLTSHFAEPI
jgi:hypothetical protein